MSTGTDEPAILSFDFVRLFPHKTWVSDWSGLEGERGSFRYKIMSARHAEGDVYELVIVLQNGDRTKQVLKHLELQGGVDGTARVFVRGLSQEYGIDFEEQDFSSCRSADEFEAAADRYGWKDY